jgi:putative nucleotidyltransferase with HDIG domain
MPLSKLTQRLPWWAAEVLLLVGTVAAGVWLASPGEWHPLALAALLLTIAFGGEWFSVETSAGQLSASLGAMVLAMGLLGPAPAAACGVAAMIQRSAAKRLSPALWLNNLVTYAVAPFAGGLVIRAATGNVAGIHSQHASQSIMFGLIVLVAVSVLLALNFGLFALDLRVSEDRSLTRLVRELFLPLLPGELAVGVIATILVLGYRSAGLPILLAAIPVFLIFRHLTVALLRSEDRAEQLAARSRQLVGLQLGVLRTLVRTLGKRDETTGRHAAAVAGYAKALAAELGCNEDERDVVHAAGLLHEIGKFTWPDRVLHAETVPEEDLAIVKSHPQEGAMLVGALDGYGAVADAILYHHERVDGRGYPAGLIGREIPVASRILAICSIYDTVTARGGYRAQMTPEEATAELRRGAENGQLDAEFVERFLGLLEREGATFAQDADFETELEFERRVAELARPHSGEAKTPSPRYASTHELDRRTRILVGLRQRVLNKD